MCLYPSIIENPKYAKSNEKSKRTKDYRLRWEGSLSQYQLWDIESKYYEKYGYPIGKYW